MNLNSQNQGNPWVRAIDHVLHGEGFSLAFQPIVDLQHGAVVGY
jgi:EAL domain-containing protein (putative c-di-GMP-specific phosphodiesterase class I)